MTLPLLNECISIWIKKIDVLPSICIFMNVNNIITLVKMQVTLYLLVLLMRAQISITKKINVTTIFLFWKKLVQ